MLSSQQVGRWRSLSRSPLNGHVSLAPRWRSAVSGGQSCGGQAYSPALAGEWITPQVGQVGRADAGDWDCAPAACEGCVWSVVKNPFDHSLSALYFHTSSYLASPPPDSLTNNYSDGCPIWRRCIIEGLELELIKENSLVSVTHHFEVAEYFKRSLFLRGNEIQTKSEEEEDFVCFCHCSGAQMEDLE